MNSWKSVVSFKILVLELELIAPIKRGKIPLREHLKKRIREVGNVGDKKMNSYFVIKNYLAQGSKHLITKL